MVRVALFDIDGTLIRTKGAGVRAFERTGENLFHIIDGVRHMHFAGRTDPSLVREFFTHHRIEPTADHFERFFDHYVFLLDQLLREQGGHVCPGVPEFIAGLECSPQAPLLGLLTGNIRLGAEIKLRHFGLWEHFATGAFGDDHEDRNRLAGVARRRAGQALGRDLRGDEVLVIGDTPRDIECGRAIGARVLAVGTGGARLDELRAHRPDWLVETLAETSASEVCG
jgi:phosphoglycolate phosphatase-like HAD superfamily hydrolase